MEFREAHKRRKDRVLRLLAQQRSNISTKDAYEQYDRIKGQSTRRRNQIPMPDEEASKQ